VKGGTQKVGNPTFWFIKIEQQLKVTAEQQRTDVWATYEFQQTIQDLGTKGSPFSRHFGEPL